MAVRIGSGKAHVATPPQITAIFPPPSLQNNNILMAAKALYVFP